MRGSEVAHFLSARQVPQPFAVAQLQPRSLVHGERTDAQKVSGAVASTPSPTPVREKLFKLMLSNSTNWVGPIAPMVSGGALTAPLSPNRPAMNCVDGICGVCGIGPRLPAGEGQLATSGEFGLGRSTT